MHPVAKDLNQISDELNAVYFERRSLIEAAMLALCCKNHVFVLGPPGTAKTAALSTLMARFPGATTFEALLSRTRPDAAILGPYNLPELRDKGDFHRKTNGFLPTANLAMLDEIGKMSPVLGHDLLAILNERVYHEVNGGRSAHPVPLYTCFTAANELITNDSDDAAALWDRLLIRVVVDYIQESGNFESMLQQAVLKGGKSKPATTIQFADLAAAVDDVVPAIPLSADALRATMSLRDKLRAEQIHPSDRRFQKSVNVMQAAAFLAGRDEVTEDDVQVLRYTLWDTPEQIKQVERLSLSVSNPDAEALLNITDAIEEINLGIDARKEQAHQSRAQYGSEVFGKLKLMSAQLKELRDGAATNGRSTTRIDAANDARMAVQRRIYIELLEMPEAAAGVV
jgi:MoxR-like ATPase